MKTKLLTKIFGVILCVCVILPTFTSCKGPDVDGALTVYMLGEGAQLPYDEYTTYDVGDDSVAIVSEEGFVSALKVGETFVTANTDGATKNYKIVVKDERDEDSKRFSNFKNIDESTAYVGAGINLLICGNPSSQDCILTSSVLDKDKVTKSGKLAFSNENNTKTTTISGDSMTTFSSDYATQIKVSGSAKYGKMFSASIDTDFSSTASIKNTTQTKYLKFYSYVERMTLNLTANREDLSNMLNSEFVQDLYGKGSNKMTPAEVIEKYGSHIILSASYGGRMEFTYFLSSTDTATTASDMEKISGKVSVAISNFSTDINGSYSKDAKESATSKNVSIYESSKVIGGVTTDMSSVDAMRQNYKTWLTSLDDSNNYSMIGLVNANSLLEIWSFLPDGDRKNNFIRYFAQESNKSYNNLLSKYNRTSLQAKALSYGEYPQSEASVNVRKALENNEGTQVGSFLTDGDVLLYEDTRYLKYTPTATSNSYEKGKVYYFKFEPITWEFYETDSSGQNLYTTTSIIDCMQWYDDTVHNKTFPSFSELTDEQKLEVYEKVTGKPLVNFHRQNYYNNVYGDSAECGNFYTYLCRHISSSQSAFEEDLERKYKDLCDEENKVPTSKKHWETSTLREFLNGTFVSFAFTDNELSSLGKVHTYANEKGKVGVNTTLVMDDVSIAPNMAVTGDGNYYGMTIKATDFAYARGLTGSTPFWASRSDYIKYGNYCLAGWSSDDPGAYTYNTQTSKNWQFAGVGTDAYFGVRATIAIR